jgi:hypothetical protein
MESLTDIAEARIQSVAERITSELPGQIEALKQRQAANGSDVLSDSTISGIVDLGISAIEEVTKEIVTQHEWVLRQALLPRILDVDVMRSRAEGHIAAIAKHGEAHTRAIFELECLPKIEAARQRALTDIGLSLRARMAERKHSGIRQVGKLIAGLGDKVVRLFRP